MARHFLGIQQALGNGELYSAYCLPGPENPADGVAKAKGDMAPQPRLLKSKSYCPGARRLLRGLTFEKGSGARWGFFPVSFLYTPNPFLAWWASGRVFLTMAPCGDWLQRSWRNFLRNYWRAPKVGEVPGIAARKILSPAPAPQASSGADRLKLLNLEVPGAYLESFKETLHFAFPAPRPLAPPIVHPNAVRGYGFRATKGAICSAHLGRTRRSSEKWAGRMQRYGDESDGALPPCFRPPPCLPKFLNFGVFRARARRRCTSGLNSRLGRRTTLSDKDLNTLLDEYWRIAARNADRARSRFFTFGQVPYPIGG